MGELTRRIAFTVGALLLYRLGSYIPIPGIDPEVWARVYATGQNSMFGSANAVSGGAISRLSIFALGLMPYIAAAVLIQVLSVVFGGVREVSHRGESGRRLLLRWTFGLTVALAAFQGFGIASALQQVGGLIASPGAPFVFTTMLTFIGGTLVLVWLAEQITRYGIGNGIVLILLTGITLEVLQAVWGALQLNNLGVLSFEFLLGLALLAVALVFAVAFVEGGRLVLPVQYASRKLGAQDLPTTRGAIRLKLNNAGILPAVIAPWFLYIPLAFLSFLFGSQPWFHAVMQEMQVGQFGHMLFNSAVTIVLAFVYTASVIDPDDVAERLKAYGGAIQGIAPGEATADLVDRLVSRTTIIGALFLVLIYLIPELLIAYAKVPFYLGGASALIAVGAVLDIDAQVRGLTSPVKVGG